MVENLHISSPLNKMWWKFLFLNCRNIWSYACVHPYKELGSNELIEAKLEGDYVKDFFVDAVLFSSSRSFEGGMYIGL